MKWNLWKSQEYWKVAECWCAFSPHWWTVDCSRVSFPTYSFIPFFAYQRTATNKLISVVQYSAVQYENSPRLAKSTATERWTASKKSTDVFGENNVEYTCYCKLYVLSASDIYTKNINNYILGVKSQKISLSSRSLSFFYIIRKKITVFW